MNELEKFLRTEMTKAVTEDFMNDLEELEGREYRENFEELVKDLDIKFYDDRECMEIIDKDESRDNIQ